MLLLGERKDVLTRGCVIEKQEVNWNKQSGTLMSHPPTYSSQALEGIFPSSNLAPIYERCVGEGDHLFKFVFLKKKINDHFSEGMIALRTNSKMILEQTQISLPGHQEGSI